MYAYLPWNVNCSRQDNHRYHVARHPLQDSVGDGYLPKHEWSAHCQVPGVTWGNNVWPEMSKNHFYMLMNQLKCFKLNIVH